ncbi:uncharacterized protein LOC117659835 [Pantherophis guttatus]|uniref:Uncharacterized protein LOC117659835 n=1 Tax=Pantherophis guttatus TaxID=94885 RepID=A0A6P9B6T7_PANGU|nr:uncharacterized protein LOC117659835 [Pantherophis guttatus]
MLTSTPRTLQTPSALSSPWHFFGLSARKQMGMMAPSMSHHNPCLVWLPGIQEYLENLIIRAFYKRSYMQTLQMC